MRREAVMVEEIPVPAPTRVWTFRWKAHINGTFSQWQINKAIRPDLQILPKETEIQEGLQTEIPEPTLLLIMEQIQVSRQTIV